MLVLISLIAYALKSFIMQKIDGKITHKISIINWNLEDYWPVSKIDTAW